MSWTDIIYDTRGRSSSYCLAVNTA